MKDDAVLKATGKSWKQWFALLDKAGAKKMIHRDIAKMVQIKYLGSQASTNVTTNEGWWSQMITVEYERARGMRKPNQNEFGYMVSAHKTLPMPVREVVKEWEKVVRSKKVASKKLETISNKTKRMQIRYKAVEGRVVVSFDERTGGKSRIAIEATRLKSAKSVERERAFWKKILETIE